MTNDLKKKYIYGSLAAFMSALGFGSIPIFAVQVYEQGVSVLTLLTFRFAVSAVILGIFNYRSFDKQVWAKFNYFGLVLIGIIYAAFNFSYFTAFNLIPTSLAALIFYTYPILVAILAVFLGQEKIGVRKSFAVAAAFLGIYLVYSDFNIVAVKIGLAVAVLASVFYAFYIIGGNILLSTTNFLNVVFFTCTISAVLFFSLGYSRGELNFDHSAKIYFYLSLITLIALISLIAILYGIKYTTPTVAAVISMAEPVVTVFLSLLILAETFSALQYLGSIIVFVSSLYVVLRNPSL